MAKIKPFSDDVYGIFEKAAQFSKKYYQTWCGTPHLFMSLISFLSKNKETPRYGKTYEKLKGILNTYGLDGKTFEKNFLTINPQGVTPGEDEVINITADRDYENIGQKLSRRAVEEQRSMEVEDFITELFAETSYVLFTICSVATGLDGKTEEMYKAIVKEFKNEKRKIESDLDKIKELTNINQWVIDHPQTVLGADDAVGQLFMALSSRTNASAALIGKAGVGKTSILYELAQRLNAGNVPLHLRNLRIYQLDSTALVAGSKFRGDMEEKVMNILENVKKDPDAILFVDEAHQLMGLGSGSEGGQGADNMLKPYLSRGDIRMIIATTNDEYTKFIEKDKAFARRFKKVLIQEPTLEETKEIIRGLIPSEQKFFDKEMAETLVEKIVQLSNQYSLSQANPAKAIEMMDLAFAHCKVFEEEKKEITIDNILESIRMTYSIHISDTKAKDCKEELEKELLGQKEPIAQIYKNLKGVERGLYDPERVPLACIFAGSTGTGKTRSAEIIAEKYFGNKERNLIVLNGGEYADQTALNKINGASAGYVGYDDEPALIKQIKQNPGSVILIDEFEKMDKSVQKAFLSIIDKGEMTDNKGNRISFRNAIIIFTTNLGCEAHMNDPKGMGFVQYKVNNKGKIKEALEKYCRPEFLGRIDDVVIFNSLNNEIGEELIERYRKFFCKQSGLEIKFKKKDIEEILKNADIENFGARNIKKVVKDHILEMID